VHAVGDAAHRRVHVILSDDLEDRELAIAAAAFAAPLGVAASAFAAPLGHAAAAASGRPVCATTAASATTAAALGVAASAATAFAAAEHGMHAGYARHRRLLVRRFIDRLA